MNNNLILDRQGVINGYMFFYGRGSNLKEVRGRAVGYNSIFNRKYSVVKVAKNETLEEALNALRGHTRETARGEGIETRRRVSVFVLEKEGYLFTIHTDAVNELEAFKDSPLKLKEVVDNVVAAYVNGCLSNGHIAQLKKYEERIVEFVRSQNIL